MAVRYKVLARASLRHYFPSAQEETEVEAARPMTARELLDALRIPHPEVMLVSVAGEAIKLDAVLGESCTVELFPVLSGG